MRIIQYMVSLFLIWLLTEPIHAQNNSNALLREVYHTIQKTRDYKVQARITVEMPSINMQPVNVMIYFKQKDLFKVISKDIAIVPKQAFIQISKLLADSNSYTAMVQGNEKIESTQTCIVNVIPLSEMSDIILGKFWIDPVQRVIIRSQFTTRSNGTIITGYRYGSQVAFGLPDQMVFYVDVKKFKLPKNSTDTPDKSPAPKQDPGPGNTTGKITIDLSGYQVNKGIPDDIFTK